MEEDNSTKPNRIRYAKAWVARNERLVTSGAFIGGFGLDLLTLNRIDQWFDNVVLLTYLTVAGIALLIINTDIEERFGWKWLERASPLALYVAQFAFGGLLSGFVIFYTKSASLYVAWPFLILLYVMFLANDRIRHYYKRFEFQIAAFFAAIFAMAILFVPTFLRMIGDLVFILSGIVSLVLIIIYLRFVYFLLPTISARRRWNVRRNIFFIFLLFNLAYFSNIIPPIPLSLKQGEIYHDVSRAAGETEKYLVIEETYPWYRPDLYLWKNEFHKTESSDTVYAFVSIFGPERLSATITHKWQWYNPQTETWKDVIESQYELTGGRDGGFRWYSFVENPTPGDWRVRVTTLNDKEIGRITFTVIEGSPNKVTLKQKKI